MMFHSYNHFHGSRTLQTYRKYYFGRKMPWDIFIYSWYLVLAVLL
jgi:hypothetical protein